MSKSVSLFLCDCGLFHRFEHCVIVPDEYEYPALLLHNYLYNEWHNHLTKQNNERT